MEREFFKKMALDSTKMIMSDNAKYAVLQARDDLLSDNKEEAIEILTNLLAAIRKEEGE